MIANNTKDVVILVCNTSNECAEGFPRYLALKLTPEFVGRAKELMQLCKDNGLLSVSLPVTDDTAYCFCGVDTYPTWEAVEESEEEGFDVDEIKIYATGSVCVCGSEPDQGMEAWTDAFDIE